MIVSIYDLKSSLKIFYKSKTETSNQEANWLYYIYDYVLVWETTLLNLLYSIQDFPTTVYFKGKVIYIVVQYIV